MDKMLLTSWLSFWNRCPHVTIHPLFPSPAILSEVQAQLCSQVSIILLLLSITGALKVHMQKWVSSWHTLLYICILLCLHLFTQIHIYTFYVLLYRFVCPTGNMFLLLLQAAYVALSNHRSNTSLNTVAASQIWCLTLYLIEEYGFDTFTEPQQCNISDCH